MGEWRHFISTTDPYFLRHISSHVPEAGWWTRIKKIKIKKVKIQALGKHRETAHEILMSEVPHVIILEIEKAVRAAIEPPRDALRIRDGDDSPVNASPCESPFVSEEFLQAVCERPPVSS